MYIPYTCTQPVHNNIKKAIINFFRQLICKLFYFTTNDVLMLTTEKLANKQILQFLLYQMVRCRYEVWVTLSIPLYVISNTNKGNW